MIDFRLYLVTDRRLAPARALDDAVADACRAGVRAVQLREKDLDAKSLFELALGLRRIASSSGAAFFVNDRADIARAARAAGLHCPEDGFPPEVARRILGERAIIGVSTHSLEAALDAEEHGADFITFGPVFETPSKFRYGAPQGLQKLRSVAAAAKIPVFAIGGVTSARAKICLDHGARGVAVVSAILGASDVGRAVGDFEKAMGGL